MSIVVAPKIKVCGMTKPSQVRQLVDMGVDAIGMILHASSPRLISLTQAQEIQRQIPAFVTLVGVFVDCDIKVVNDYIKQVPLDLIQLHGRETPEYGARLARPYIKALRAKTKSQVLESIGAYSNAKAILLDPYVQGKHGGTGMQLAPQTWPLADELPNSEQKLILAGGLSPANIVDSVKRFTPYAVDINSGVEVEPGIKNMDKVAECLNLIRSVNS